MTMVLTPSVGSTREVMTAAMMAARLAHQQGLIPIAPLLYCSGFLNPAEAQQEMRWTTAGFLPTEPQRATLIQKLFQRCQRVWLAFPSAEYAGDLAQDLDRLSFQLLNENESLRDRRPVALVTWRGNRSVLEHLSHQEVISLLRANVTMGLSGGLDCEV